MAFRELSGLKLFSPVGDDSGADTVNPGSFGGGDLTGLNLSYQLFFEACFELSYTGKGEMKKRYLIIISDVIGILLNEQATYSNAYKGAITVSGVGMAGTQKR